MDDIVLKFLRLLDQRDGGISLLKDVKMLTPRKSKHLDFKRTNDRPEMKELFAFMTGKVRTLCASGAFFFANFSRSAHLNFILSVQHLIFVKLDAVPEDKSKSYYWAYLVKFWLFNNEAIDGRPRLMFIYF